MLKLVFWILFLVVALIVAALSIANRHVVMFSLDPLPFAFDLPLYALLLAAGFIGLLLGSLSTWLRGHGVRRENRQHRREVAELKGQNLTLTRDLEKAKAEQQQAAPGSTQARQLEHHASH